jgi:hypothetical protein
MRVGTTGPHSPFGALNAQRDSISLRRSEVQAAGQRT